MKKLHNLPIKQKFAIVLIPLIAIIIYFDYLQIRHDYLNYTDSRRLNKAINVGIDINHLVHEVQKERSITSGYLSNGGEKFSDELEAQRQHTDSTLAQFYEKISASAYKDLMVLHDEDIDNLKSHINRIKDLRTQVDALSLKAEQAIKYYSEINKVALSTVSALINETRDKEAAQQVHAIIYFLESKEFASVERAIGTQIFSIPEPSKSMLGEITRLISAQDSYLDAFLTICNTESFDFYHRIVQGQDIDEVNRMRSLLYTNQNLETDPNYWYKIATNKINSLKRVEEFMLDHMHVYTESISASARWNFWRFLIINVIVGALSLYLMTSIVTKLLKNVNRLESFTNKVSGGDLSETVSIDTKDEIGQYARTFNEMVSEINKTHEELKNEKAQAEYLYENIYKQSEVVFENVEQGIFLLDKELKISNLYSKAVERIFDNKIIAHENFSNFMRPRLIQRDFEALEMFMKHLFNADIDEDVVNQLNPIEQVKIFIGTNGVVVTKYLRISFTRIEREGDIQNILVTISDETESVLLQQHMEESEAKKKQETEYMLNILKVDPTILTDFLQSTRKILKGISQKYEESGKSNLNDLLKYTFQTIHNVKGNAMSIGLELITDKLHSIEDAISALMEKNVTGDKFLAILYDIEEVDKTISDMSKLLVKVADIYSNFPTKNNKVSNNKLDETLAQGLKIMCKETGKDVELSFENESSIVLNECHASPIKDVVIQLMRNSMSHGIEGSNERLAHGKSEKGKIMVSLSQSTDQTIAVCYKDDGRGLDPAMIKEKALNKGLITSDEALTMNDDEVIDLLFADGFSTSDEVNNYSGRGQGLSLVKSIIAKQNGAMDVQYKKGEFFEVRFKIPLVQQENGQSKEIDEEALAV